MNLTPRQSEVLAFIQATTIAIDGAPPTRAEIARAFDFKSPNATECHLRALQRTQLLKLEFERQARGGA
jgi:repressor LexA